MAVSPTESSAVKIASALSAADRVLIVAAAGLSIHDQLPNNPYHSRSDFAKHYPKLLEYGYSTAYETMGLAGDPDVPRSVKSAFRAQHMLNMSDRFPPTPGYDALLRMSFGSKAKPNRQPGKDVFCWTSNGDACFRRAGFPEPFVFTTQGEMPRFQCTSCNNVWDAKEQLELSETKIVNDELQDPEANDIACPNCGNQKLLPNLRGGDWFISKPYVPHQQRLRGFMNGLMGEATSGAPQKLCIVEVGIGPNTPIVTGIPAVRFGAAAAAAGNEVTYIRINPDKQSHRYLPNPEEAFGAVKLAQQHEPADTQSQIGSLRFVDVRETWRPLVEASSSDLFTDAAVPDVSADQAESIRQQGLEVPKALTPLQLKVFEGCTKVIHGLTRHS